MAITFGELDLRKARCIGKHLFFFLSKLRYYVKRNFKLIQYLIEKYTVKKKYMYINSILYFKIILLSVQP